MARLTRHITLRPEEAAGKVVELRTRWRTDGVLRDWLDELDELDPDARWQWPSEAVQACNTWAASRYRGNGLGPAPPPRPRPACTVCNDLALDIDCPHCGRQAATPPP